MSYRAGENDACFRGYLMKTIFSVLPSVLTSIILTLLLPAFAERNFLAQTTDQTLAPGVVVGHELKSGESKTHRISLETDRYVELSVRQDRAGISVKAFDPEGRQLTETISDRTTNRIFFVADKTAEYRLEVHMAPRSAHSTRYELKIGELRSATAADRNRIAANHLAVEAAHLSRQGIAGTGGPEIWKRAVRKSEEALRAFESIGDRVSLSEALGGMGRAYWLGGEKRRSLDYFERQLSIERELGDRWATRSVLNSLGEVNYSVGEPLKAAEYYQEALLLNPVGDGLILYNISFPYRDVGDYQRALDYLRQALALWTKSGEEKGQAYVLRNMGMLYASLGEPHTARTYYDQALAVSREAKSPLNEASSLILIGLLLNSSGEPDRALENFARALEIARAIGDRTGEPAALYGSGLSYAVKGEHQKSLEKYAQAISIYRGSGDRVNEARVLHAIGESYRMSADLPKAVDHYRQALLLERAAANRNAEAETLLGLARANREMGLLTDAHADAVAALDIVESLRARIFGQDLRASLVASRRHYYEFLTGLLMDMHRTNPALSYDAEALRVNERARARVLLDTLAESRADIRQGIDTAMLKQEHTLQQRLSAKSARLAQILSAPHDELQEIEAKKEIEALVGEYRDIQARIRAGSPRYAALTQPAPLSLAEIQQQLLDDDTLLLEYALGEQKSFVWAITTTSIKSFELPNRATIDAAVRGVYDLLTARSKSIANGTAAQKRAQIQHADNEFPRAAAALSGLILQPVAAELGKKRLIVVSDGLLQYVPFTALPIPQVGSQPPTVTRKNSGYKPLVAEYEVINLPSASVLAALRNETLARPRANRMVAVLADPVFNRDDSRIQGSVQSGANPAQSLPADLLRSADESGLKGFARLRFSRAEADAISQLVPADTRLRAVDFAANRSTATSADLTQYRIVHFATHGLINSRHPELSGLVLSLVNEKGQTQDGFLRLYEIYNLRLRADLVVLSACQTALGKEIKGEGLVGLTRGFMYAGSPRVVASLWRVDDRATAELMRRFYNGMLGKQKLTPAAALRQAQLEMWKTGWDSPAFWAAFTLQGEWR